MSTKEIKQHAVIVPDLGCQDGVGTVGVDSEQLKMLIKVGDTIRSARNMVVVMCDLGQESSMLGNFTLSAEALLAKSRLEVWDDMAKPDRIVPKKWMVRAGQLRENSFIFMTLGQAKALGLPQSQLVPGIHPVRMTVTKTARVSDRVPAAVGAFDPNAPTRREGPQLQAARDQALAQLREQGIDTLDPPEEEPSSERSTIVFTVVVLTVLVLLTLVGWHLQH